MRNGCQHSVSLRRPPLKHAGDRDGSWFTWDNRFEVYQGQLQRLSLQRKP